MGKAKLLIADDDVTITMNLEDLLNTNGYTVVGPVHSSDDAYNLARKEKPDLAFLDIKMPGKMDGIELAETLLTEFNIPCIFVSGYDDYAIIERAKRVKPLSFLLKPFADRQVLVETQIALFKVNAIRERQFFNREEFPIEIPKRYAGLTPTELRVAALVRKGKTSKEVAELMDIRITTVQWHRRNIRKKLNLVNKSENLTMNLLL